MAMYLFRRGRFLPVPRVEKALRYVEREGLGDGGNRMVVGAPAAVRAGLEDRAQAYGAEELIAVTITHEHAARRRSYELVAEAFGLSAAEPLAA